MTTTLTKILTTILTITLMTNFDDQPWRPTLMTNLDDQAWWPPWTTSLDDQSWRPPLTTSLDNQPSRPALKTNLTTKLHNLDQVSNFCQISIQYLSNLKKTSMTEPLSNMDPRDASASKKQVQVLYWKLNQPVEVGQETKSGFQVFGPSRACVTMKGLLLEKSWIREYFAWAAKSKKLESSKGVVFCF